MSRIFYSDCRIEVSAFGDADAFECDDAEVWTEDDSIIISYFDDEGLVVLEGVARSEGGWDLAARSRPRRATLSPVDATAAEFSGSIQERGEDGHWTLQLGTPAQATNEAKED